MIVYGDPSRPATLSGVRRHLEGLLTGALSLDALREALILAGKLEQAAADLEADFGCEPLTDAFAWAFLAALDGEVPNVAPAWASLTRLPERPVSLDLKTPEGFAFYALYPEAYVLAARQWRSANGDASEVLVVGVRSIGTTLSAVVGATLEKSSSSLRVRRTTVRPEGHPFAREVTRPVHAVGGATHALVVDEGPGISGSSMASVVAALKREGGSSLRISLLPGHFGEPGFAASESVRAVWRDHPRFVGAAESLRWSDRNLGQVLADETERLVGMRPERIEDLSGGGWREVVGFSGPDRPPALTALERPKLRAVLTDGRRVLWKFYGLGEGASSAFSELSALAAKGWTVAPLGTALGYVAIPWVVGRTPVDPALGPLLEYARTASGPDLTPDEARLAHARLANILTVNVREALGEEAIPPVERLLANAPLAGPRYGDGRMAPWEWVVTDDGRWLKTDPVSHDVDHTAVGPQSWQWDLAGLAVEWNLSSDKIAEGLLPLYRAAYAAFRMGACAMAADGTQDTVERRGLEAARDQYRDDLRRTLLAVPD